MHRNLWEISYLAIKRLSDSFNGNAETTQPDAGQNKENHKKKVPNLFSISFGKTRPISSQLVKLDLTLSQVRIYFDILSSKKRLHARDDADVPHYLQDCNHEFTMNTSVAKPTSLASPSL